MRDLGIKKGNLVVKVLSLGGVETATIERIESVSKAKDEIRLCDSRFVFGLDGRNKDGDWGMGSTRLVVFDGGEVQRWRLKERKP